MALRSPALWMGDPAVQHPAENDRLLLSALLRPDPASTAANRPLAALSGVLHGPAGTMGEVTLLSNAQFNVNPARWAIQAASASGGHYIATNDGVTTLGITAQDATQYRKSYFGVWVQDKFVAGAGDNSPHWGLIDGALAAANPQLPGAGLLPANWLALGEFLIPPVGQAVTYTPYDVRTGLRGGVLPVTATDTRAPASDGQIRWHPTNRLEVGVGGAWEHPAPAGIVGMFSMSADGPAISSTAFQRIAGGINGACNLRTGRVYQVSWYSDVVSSAAGQAMVLGVGMSDGAANNPQSTDPYVASASHSGSPTAGQPIPLVISGLFRVNTAKSYLFSPWMRRGAVAPNTGTVTAMAQGGLNGIPSIQWIQVEDKGSYGFLTANTTLNPGAIPLVTV